MRLLPGWLFVAPLKKVESGTYFTSVDDSKSQGTVVGVPDDPSTVKVGDKVLFGKEFEPSALDGQPISVMKESNIFAILEGAQNE